MKYLHSIRFPSPFPPQIPYFFSFEIYISFTTFHQHRKLLLSIPSPSDKGAFLSGGREAILGRESQVASTWTWLGCGPFRMASFHSFLFIHVQTPPKYLTLFTFWELAPGLQSALACAYFPH